MMSPEDKQNIFPSGVPLFWLETKSMAFWLDLLEQLQVKTVVDITPGSGILASACMELGVPYFGMCINHQHHTWLSNVMDRMSLKYITQSGSALHMDDLASQVSDIFADMLASLQEGEEGHAVMEEEEEEEGDPDDA